MKSVIFFLILLIGSPALAQTSNCDCSGALSKHLKDSVITTQYNDLKQFLYEYIASDATIQTSKKQNRASTWNASAAMVIDGLPVKGQADGSQSTSKEGQAYSRLVQSFEKNESFSDVQFNYAVAERLSDNQLTAYLACLRRCENEISNIGLKYNVEGDVSDIFSIRIGFRSFPPRATIRLQGDAILNNLVPYGPNIFRDQFEITDGESWMQFYKRIDPALPASFSLNIPNAQSRPIILPAIRRIIADQIPVGSIVASVLEWTSFARLNNQAPTISDADSLNTIWVPADGRSVANSRYGKFGHNNVPDLRGVFLRGVNDFRGLPVVLPVSSSQGQTGSDGSLVDRVGNHFEPDETGKHDHQQNTTVADGGNGTASIGARSRTGSEPDYVRTAFSTGSESRPKNISVYYYIKIN